MSTTEQPPTEQEGPRVSAEEVRDLGRLRRTLKTSPEGRHLGGVAGGLARHLDVDPVIVRVVFVVLVFFGGAGILLYVAGCLFVPAEDTGKATIDLDERTRSFVLYIAGGVSVLAILGDSFGRWDFPWPILAVGLIALVVLGRGDRFRMGQRQPAAPAATTPPAATSAPVTSAAPAGEPVWTGGYTPPPAYSAPVPNPRKRGPILFWFTIALIALLEGILGLIDVAGADIARPAYAALAVGVTGVMLALGAFWGRAGGLILVGLISTLWLIGSIAEQESDDIGRRIHADPVLASQVDDTYKLNVGELVLDLTDVADPAGLDGRAIDVEGGVGKIVVVVPDAWGVEADAQVGVGNARVLGGGESGGFGIEATGGEAADGAAEPSISFDVHLGVGSIEVVQQSDYVVPDHGYAGWSER